MCGFLLPFYAARNPLPRSTRYIGWVRLLMAARSATMVSRKLLKGITCSVESPWETDGGDELDPLIQQRQAMKGT